MEMLTCYICGNTTDDFMNIQDERAEYSGKLLRELIEYISGCSVDLPDIICPPCTAKLNSYDELTLKAEQIQGELKTLMDNKIFIKQEPKDELDNTSMASNETETYSDRDDGFPYEANVEIDIKPLNMSAHFDWNKIGDGLDSETKKISPKRRQKKDQVFQCTFAPCERRFDSKFKFVHHLQLHSTERPFQCSFCGKFYKTKDCLRSHQRVVHRNADLRVICDTCGLAFTRKPSLERHYKAAHLKLKAFVCQLCGASYCNSSSLQAHAYVHDKDNKNFVCEICEARFHNRSKLNRHMRCHSEKQFECPICHRKYSQRYNLTAHMRQVHEEHQLLKTGHTPPIVCQLCGRIFDRQTALSKHLKNVHEAVPISGSLE